jgi:hypothetical protein
MSPLNKGNEDQSQMSLTKNGPIKVQNFLFGQQSPWDDMRPSQLENFLQSPKYQELAQAVSMYLNGDYQQVRLDDNCLLNDQQDVDEWLLSGEREDSVIMKKIEENQAKQLLPEVEKTYIIDDIDEEGLTDASTATRDKMQNLYNKTYIKERRVTTV